MNQDHEFKCQTCASQETADECLCIKKLNGKSLEVVERVCYFGNIIGAREG